MTYKITYTLIAVNILIYLISAGLSHNLMEIDTKVLLEMGALYGPDVIQKGEWWRLLSAMFLHAGMTHILMNMFSLYYVGKGVEQYFDDKSYLSIYLFSGLIGGVTSLYVHPDSLGVGASGAIFGIFGALAGFFMANRDKIEDSSKAFMKNFAGILGVNIVLGLAIPSIDISAHIGGLVAGFVGGYVLSKNPNWVWAYSGSMLILIVATLSMLSS